MVLFMINSLFYVLYFYFFNVPAIESFLDKLQQCITTVKLLTYLPVVNKKQSTKPVLIKDSYLKKLERLSRQSFFTQSTNCLHYSDKVMWI